MRQLLIGVFVLFALVSCINLGNDKDNLEGKIILNNNTTDSIGRISLAVLSDSGFVVEPFKYKITKVFHKEFNKHVIPIKVCASFTKDGFGNVDSLIVTFREKTHKIYVPENDFFLNQTNDILSLSYNIRLDDYNFDNYPDIAIYNTNSGLKNIMENIYIYNPEENGYFRNVILSKSSNCSIDTTNQTISTFGQGGMASMIYGSTTYIWEDDNLIAIKNINQDYIDSLDVFVKKTRRLVEETWTLSIDTLTEEQARY